MLPTYCNPLPLPGYPRGRSSPHKDKAFGWLQPEKSDWRETADPSVLYHDGRWYLYPSCGMAWVSEDFATWTHHPLEPADIGYAPTVVRHRDRFLMTACGAGIWSAPTPLGPFAEIGRLRDPDGNEVGGFNDPMLFADDDGRLYCYWGLGEPGIFGAEVDPERPDRLLTAPRILFRYDPAQVWERYGEHNEDASRSYIEGAWMVKVGRTYHLTYAGPGTEWKTYAMGACTSSSPLGPFTRQRRNPFCTRTEGMIQGPGHGCVVAGPKGTLWAFYTCRVCYEHIFERRIGMDPVHIDERGELWVPHVSSTPQFAPGVVAEPGRGNGAHLLPVNHRKPTRASSCAPGRPGFYAVDDGITTWWQPAAGDAAPILQTEFLAAFTVSALRLQWKEVGLDYDAGHRPGPFRYVVETQAQDDDAWEPAVDAAANAVDLLIDYRTFTPRVARRARLRVLGAPAGITPGVIDCSVFGR